jgi:hypothetical protein
MVQMPASGTSVRGWVARFRPRPVVLSSPYPVGECLRRLAEVTTVRGPTAWYLDPKTALRPDPRLRGDLGPSGISVVRWPAARGRPHSFQPWLRVRPEPAAGGGTTLTGTIGITPEERAVLWIIYGATGLIALGAIAGGIGILANGDIAGVLALLLPFALFAFPAGLSAAGLRLLEADIPRLIEEVNEILGSVATFPGPADAAHRPRS